jgi:hypothetical protein
MRFSEREEMRKKGKKKHCYYPRELNQYQETEDLPPVDKIPLARPRPRASF